jgi:ferritin-like metal-binding protein YciE
MNDLTNLTDRFYQELQILWAGEKLLMETLPELMAESQDMGLKFSLSLHFAETDQQKVALEFICKQLNICPWGKQNTELQAIEDESNISINTQAQGKARDLAIIEGCKKVEQYEISAYTNAANNADLLGHKLVAKKLRAILLEEQQAENKLNFLAKNISGQNAKAA